MWALYERYGWAALIEGPVPGHSVSGCEQTQMVAMLRSRDDPASVDGAVAGILCGLAEIRQRRVRALPIPPPVGPPPISGGLPRLA